MRGLATLKVHLGAIIAQRQGWKTLRGPPGDVHCLTTSVIQAKLCQELQPNLE